MSLLKAGLKFGTINILILFISFVSSVFIVRLLGSEIYGQYIYITALVAIVPLWYNAYDQILIRFGSIEDTQNKISYLRAILFSKLIIFLLAIGGLLVYINYFEKDLFKNAIFNIIIYLLIAKEFIALFQATFGTIVNIYEKYMLLTYASFGNALSYLVFVGIIYFLNYDSLTALLYVVIFSFLGTIVTFFFSRNIANRLLDTKYSLFKLTAIEIKNIYSRDKLKYFGPLQLISIQSYLKQYLPQLLLGNLSSFSNVAYYEIIRKIYNIIHKFTPKITDLFLPSIIKNKTKDFTFFSTRIKQFGLGYIFFVFFVALIALINSETIFMIFNVEYSPIIGIIFLIFSIDLLIGSIGQWNNIVIKTSNSTMGLFIGSFARTLFGTAILYWLALEYSILGVAIAKLVDTLILTMFFIHFSRKYAKLNFNRFLILLFVLYSCILIYVGV